MKDLERSRPLNATPVRMLREYIGSESNTRLLLGLPASGDTLVNWTDRNILLKNLERDMGTLTPKQKAELATPLIMGQVEQGWLPPIMGNRQAARVVLSQISFSYKNVQTREARAEIRGIYRKAVETVKDRSSLPTLEALEETGRILAQSFPKKGYFSEDDEALAHAIYQVVQKLDYGKGLFHLIPRHSDDVNGPLADTTGMQGIGVKGVVDRLTRLGFTPSAIVTVTGFQYSSVRHYRDISNRRAFLLQENGDQESASGTPGQDENGIYARRLTQGYISSSEPNKQVQSTAATIEERFLSGYQMRFLNRHTAPQEFDNAEKAINGLDPSERTEIISNLIRRIGGGTDGRRQQIALELLRRTDLSNVDGLILQDVYVQSVQAQNPSSEHYFLRSAGYSIAPAIPTDHEGRELIHAAWLGVISVNKESVVFQDEVKQIKDLVDYYTYIEYKKLQSGQINSRENNFDDDLDHTLQKLQPSQAGLLHEFLITRLREFLYFSPDTEFGDNMSQVRQYASSALERLTREEKTDIASFLIQGLGQDNTVWEQNRRDGALDLLFLIDFNDIDVAKVASVLRRAIKDQPSSADPLGSIYSLSRAHEFIIPHIPSRNKIKYKIFEEWDELRDRIIDKDGWSVAAVHVEALRPKKRLTPQQIEARNRDIVQRWNNGEPAIQIWEDYNIKENFFYKLLSDLREQGVSIVTRKRYPKPFLNDQQASLVDNYFRLLSEKAAQGSEEGGEVAAVTVHPTAFRPVVEALYPIWTARDIAELLHVPISQVKRTIDWFQKNNYLAYKNPARGNRHLEGK